MIQIKELPTYRDNCMQLRAAENFPLTFFLEGKNVFSLKMLGLGFFWVGGSWFCFFFFGKPWLSMDTLILMSKEWCTSMPWTKRILLLKLLLGCLVGLVVWMLLCSDISRRLGPLAELPFLGWITASAGVPSQRKSWACTHAHRIQPGSSRTGI